MSLCALQSIDLILRSGSHDEQTLAKFIIIKSTELNRYFKSALRTLLSRCNKREHLINLTSEPLKNGAATPGYMPRAGEMISSLDLRRQLVDVDHPLVCANHNAVCIRRLTAAFT